jgi:hypothetical protein
MTDIDHQESVLSMTGSGLWENAHSPIDQYWLSILLMTDNSCLERLDSPNDCIGHQEHASPTSMAGRAPLWGFAEHQLPQ